MKSVSGLAGFSSPSPLRSSILSPAMPLPGGTDGKRALKEKATASCSSDSSPEKPLAKKPVQPRTSTRSIKPTLKAMPTPLSIRRGSVNVGKLKLPVISASSDLDSSPTATFKERVQRVTEEAIRFKSQVLSVSSHDGIEATSSGSVLAARHLDEQRAQIALGVPVVEEVDEGDETDQQALDDVDAGSQGAPSELVLSTDQLVSDLVVDPVRSPAREVGGSASQQPVGDLRWRSIVRCPWSEIESTVPLGNKRLYESFDAATTALTDIALTDVVGTDTRRQLLEVGLMFSKVFRDALEKIDVLRGQNHALGKAGRDLPKQAPKRSATAPTKQTSQKQSEPTAGLSHVEQSSSAQVAAQRSNEWQLVQPRSKRVPPRPPKPSTFAAVVKANNEQTSADDLKNKIMADVAGELDIRVKHMIKSRNTVVIETASQAELDLLIACAKFADSGMTVEKQSEGGELIYVVGVEQSTSNETFMSQLMGKNLDNFGDEVSKKVFLRNRIKPSGVNKGGIVLEAPAEIAAQIIESGRVYCGFMSYAVQRWRGSQDVHRCYRCMGFGHNAARCSKSGDVCGNCSSSGHLKSVCTLAAKCWMCEAAKVPFDHPAGGRGCRELDKARQLAAKRHRNG